MKKFLFVLMGVFVIAGAFAAGENVPTSKSYVDAAVAQKQDKISANIIMPAGYTRLAYIESTGTQWIDTGVVFNSGIGYELEYQPKTTNNFVVQAGTTGQVIAQQGNVWEFRFNGSVNRRPSPSGIDLTQFVNIKYNIDNKCSVDNGIVYIGDLTLNAGGSIRLFGPNYRSSGRMSFFLIYDNGVLVNNLVPARRDSDGKIGMYDTISGQFFTNSGTGEFIAGPVITLGNQVLTNTGTAGEYGTKGIYNATGAYVTQKQNLVDAATMNAGVQNAIDSEFQCIEWLDPNDHTSDCLLLQLGGITEYSLPTEYTALEYINFTNGATYINTGIMLSNTNTITVKVNAENFLGVMGRWQRDRAFQIYNQYFRFGTFKANVDINSYKNQTVVISYSQDGLYIDDNLIASPTTQSFRLSEPCLIGSVGSGDSTFKGKIYEAIIKNNENIVGHFIPARRDSDSVSGMYDTVTNTFFTNAGAGEIIAGPVVNLYLPAGN